MLKGNSRGGARDLARHLMKEENEHIEMHELRGFASDTLMGALNEIYAISRGTKCKQFMYSLSLNPPEKEEVSTADFLSAIERVEQKLGFGNQSRAIVFHEKKGRRHCHCVWSRIDLAEMKAIHLSYDHKKLKGISRELFLEHGWTMPKGLACSEDRDPRNFTLADWQQAKRTGKDPRATITAIQDAWAISDSKAAFLHAMQERGFKVARGDRRGFVAIDVHCEVYSIPKKAGVKTRDVRARLGDESDLPDLAEAKKQIADEMLLKLGEFSNELEDQNRQLREQFAMRRREMVRKQSEERKEFRAELEARRIREARQRQARFRKGLGGIWDRLRGEHKRIRKQNERDAVEAKKRDQSQHDQFVVQQLTHRQQLKAFALEARRNLRSQKAELEQDANLFRGMRLAEPEPLKTRTTRNRSRIRGPTPER
ncbi:MAG: relaxase/mobilization nuclease domain-containing protein [Pseudomonadota bacterium]